MSANVPRRVDIECLLFDLGCPTFVPPTAVGTYCVPFLLCVAISVGT